MLGSGSLPARMRWSLLRLVGDQPVVTVAEMAPLYAAVGAALSVQPDALNMEGACLVGDALRWFHRGLPSAGIPPGSVDLDPEAAVAAALGRVEPATVAVTNARHYDLGDVGGVGLAITDAVSLPDGTILLSAAAEDSPNVRDDGPVVASALVRLDGDAVVDVTQLPCVRRAGHQGRGPDAARCGRCARPAAGRRRRRRPAVPSLAMRLRVSW